MKKDDFLAANDADLPTEVIREIELWEKENGRSVLNRRKAPQALARQALAKLFWKGCDPLEILTLLEAYCQSPMGPIKEELRYGNRAQNLSKRLVNDFNELRLLDIPVSRSCLDEMERISVFLLDYWRDSKTSLTPRGTKNVFLVTAAKLVKTATDEEHYPEIADVIFALCPTKKLEPNSISRNVINFGLRREFPFMTDSEIKSRANLLKKRWCHLRKKDPKR